MNITLQKKRTTRNIKPSYVVNRKTIDTQHMEYIAELQEKNKNADKLGDEIVRLEGELVSLSNVDDIDYNKLMHVQDAILDLKQKRKDLLNHDADYFTNTASILFKYYDIVDSSVSNGTVPQPAASKAVKKVLKKPESGNSILKYFGSSASPQEKQKLNNEDQQQQQEQELKKKQQCDQRYEKGLDDTNHGNVDIDKQRGSLLESYMEMTNNNYIKTSILGDISMVCRHCNSSNNTVIQNDGYMMCNMCNTIEYVIVDHDKPSYKDPPKEISYYAYKRLNHFNEWLNQVQGKETTDIPDEIFDKIMLEIKKQKIENMATLTQSHVRNILKKLSMNRYYEHVPYITCRLNGMPMPQLSPELEDKLRSMFRQIQAPFVKHSPPERKNFLSYSYVIHKFLLLLGHDEYLHCFPLLRDKSKNYASELLFKKICDDLNWQFIRSI